MTSGFAATTVSASTFSQPVWFAKIFSAPISSSISFRNTPLPKLYRSGAAESGQRTAGRVLGHHLPDHTGAVLRDRRRYPDCAGSESGVRQKIPGRQSRTRHADSGSVLRGNTACPAGCLSGTPESAEAVRNHTVAPRQTKSRSLPTAESPCFFRAPEERCQPAPLIPELAPRLPVRQITLHLAPEVGGMIAVQEMAQLMHHDVLDERMRPLAQPRIETE